MTKKANHGLIPIALPPHWSISPKMQLLICLAIGNVMGALIWNPPARSWELGSWLTDSINGAYSAISGTSQAQTPLPVPQGQPPIGNSASIQPCAAPPTMAAAPVEQMPSSLPTASEPTASTGTRHYKDPKARILMNTAPGNKMRSLLNRVSNPDRYDGQFTYWQTDDGLIAVQSDGATDRFVSSWFVK